MLILKPKLKSDFLLPPQFGSPFFSFGTDSELSHCFVNSPKNPIALRPEYYESDSHSVSMIWKNSKSIYEGYPNILHGGISATLLDALMATTALKATGYVGLTYESKMRWHRPIKIGSTLTGRGVQCWNFKQFSKIRAQLFDADEQLVASATGIFFTPTMRQFKKMIGKSDIPEDYSPYFYTK